MLSVGLGGRVRLGLAEVSFSVDGVLKACDPYGCSSFRVLNVDRVDIKPAPPMYRPRPLASCLYLEFPETLFVSDGATVVVSAPFELEVSVLDTKLTYLTPLKAKYTLVGDVVYGTICRYYRSSFIEDLSGLREGEAIVRIRFEGDRAVVPGIAFYVHNLALEYRNGNVYYPTVVATVSKRTMSIRVVRAREGEGAALARHVSGRFMISQSFVMEL